MALVCCSLVAPFDAERWRRHCLLVDPDPGTKLLPSIGHDLELSRDGQQLARASVAYVYFELFH